MNINEYIQQSLEADERVGQSLAIQHEAASVPVSLAVLQRERDETFQATNRIHNGMSLYGDIARGLVSYRKDIDLRGIQLDAATAPDLYAIQQQMVASCLIRAQAYTQQLQGNRLCG